MTCTVCRHEELETIDESLLEGVTSRNIAKRFQLSPASLHRHKVHLNETLKKARNAAELGRADTLIEQLQKLRADAASIQTKASQAGDYRGALAAIRQLERLLSVALKISDQLVKTDGNSVRANQAHQNKLCRHAARLLQAMWHFEDDVVMVITEEQACELSERLREIYGIRVSSEEALRMGNTGLSLLDEPAEPIKKSMSPAGRPF